MGDGIYSFGAGFGRIDGEVSGDTLAYGWMMGDESGRGRILLEGNDYRGNWGIGMADLGGGDLWLKAR